MKIRSLLLLCFSMVFSAILAAPAASFADNLRVVTIGIVDDGTALAFSGYVDQVKAEIEKLAGADFDIRYTETHPVQGTAVESDIDRLMKNPDIDLILAVGLLSSHAMLTRKDFPKPAIASVVIDPATQNLPETADSSGIENFTYIHTRRDLTAEIMNFRRMVPFRKAAVIEDRYVDQAAPSLQDRFGRMAGEIGADFVFIPCGGTADPVLEALPADIDAVIVTPFLRLDNQQSRKLIDGLKEKRLPGFSLWGETWVKDGLLAGVCPDANTDRIVRRAALDVLQILQGRNAATLPVAIAVNEQLMINMATARLLGTDIGWAVRTEAMLFADRPDAGDPLGFLDAVHAARENNLELAAENRQVRAGEENVRQALARLLPGLNVSSAATMVDEDRARASFGLFAERRWSGSASVNQVLYSDAAVTGYRVEKDLQSSRRAAKDALRLDIGSQTALAYLDALSASVLVRIRRNNLELTRANLVRAENRRRIGMANPAELYRWQSKIATDKKDLLTAEARFNQSKIAVNRFLNRRPDTRLILIEIPDQAPLFINVCRDLFDRLDTPERLYSFEQFMAGRAVDRSPEIDQLDAAIAAAEKRLAAARRARWLPTIFFQGAITQFFAESGAGTESVPSRFPVLDLSSGAPAPTALIVPFPDLNTDDTEWHLGINAMFNLYSGGAIASGKRQANEVLHQLKLRHRDAADRIRAGVAAVVQSAGASYPGIELSRDAADAAEKNLDLATDAYERGVISVVDLLEAQNAAITSRQVAATARHEFLKDMVRLQRAAARESYEMPPEEAQAFRNDVEQYFEASGTGIEF